MLFLKDQKEAITAQHLQIDSQAGKRKSTIETYLQIFVYYKQINQAWQLLMSKLVYNKAINGSTNHTTFKLNYGFYFLVFYKKDVDYCSKSKVVNKPVAKLKELKKLS